MRNNLISPNRLSLFKNTFALYILVFSNYFFSFITIPYQTRILGPDYYGKIAFALAMMTYFALIIDFGFLLSATEKVAKNRDDYNELNKIFTSVNIIKLILTIASFVVLFFLIYFIPRFREDSLIYLLTFFSVVAGSFLPDYLYRGLEQMKVITVRTVLVRFFFTVMIFSFLNEKEDYYLVPLITLIGNLGALVVVYTHSFKVLKIKFVRIEKEYVKDVFKRASVFFYSRIASTIYTVTNTFVLGLTNPVGSSTIGFYTSADKLINTAKSGFSPIADSLYPYLIKNKDYKLVKKILTIMMPPIIIICIAIGFYAESFTAFLLGEEFREAGKILRILMPIVVITPLTYILGFPVLTAMNLSKHANFSIIYASVIHLCLLFILILINKLNIYIIALITVFSEMQILLYRILVILANKNKMKTGV